MKRFQVWMPLLFSLVLIMGMFIGSALRQNVPGSRGIFNRGKRSTLQEVVDLVNLKYVDKVNTDTITEDAIKAMLARLDPHSVFIPAANVEEINEELQGNFEGIGVEFFIIDDTVHVTNVQAGGPSDKAGIRMGDKFLKVGDSLVAGSAITADKIKSYLRGVGGSKIEVTVLRNGKTVNASITRGTIPLYSVDAAYMIDTTIGYIHLDKFSGTTYEEFMKAMETLEQKGMKKLIFDLRGNGGGILTEATDIVDEFLDNERLIVYTQGNKQDKVEYHCKRPGLFETGKLVLLVDETSASASEVVAGALQDWDRATIVGRRTFGKGLVQEQYDLSDGSALRLTVARYYTPIGRNIQKPYNKGRAAYNGELAERFANGELVNGDTVTKHTGPAFKTKSGRIVYGGGGITPDVFIPFDTSNISSNVYVLFDNQLFNKFIYIYYQQNKAYFDQFKNPADFARRYNDTRTAWNSLISYAAKNAVTVQNVPEHDKKDIEKQIKIYLARQIWRMEGYYEVSNADDAAITKAMSEMRK